MAKRHEKSQKTTIGVTRAQHDEWLRLLERTGLQGPVLISRLLRLGHDQIHALLQLEPVSGGGVRAVG